MLIIPVRAENEERLENIHIVYTYLKSIDMNFYMCEFDTERKINLPIEFVYDDNPHFWKTKYCNYMLSKTKSDIVAFYDTDIILSKEQLEKAYTSIREGYQIVFPYFDSGFLMTNDLFKKEYIKTGNIDFVKGHGWEDNEYFKPNRCSYSVGGCVFMNRKFYINAGGDNQSIIGWGADDRERKDRIIKLGGKEKREIGFLYHLDHPRGITSSSTNPNFNKANDEWDKVKNMTKKEIVEYVKGWTWTSQF